MATGAIYHYFRGKEDLLIAICDQLTEPLLEAARELPADRDPRRRLRDLVRLWVAHVAEHRHHLLAFTQVRHLVDHGDGWSSVRAARKDFELLLGEALDEAGVAEPGLRRLALLGMVNHMPQWYRPRGALSPEQIADGWVEMVLPAG